MAKFTNCLELISRIDERDQAALVARLDELIDGGMSPSDAQAQAAVDVLASVEREGGLEAEPADLSSFEVGQLPELLRKSGWAILTAENPGGNQASEQDNAAANARLIAELRQRGLRFLPVVGRYGGTDESSFAIVGISPQEAADLGRRYGQEAVLTRDGFVYQDGGINPAKGIEVFKEPPEDFFSRVTTGAGDAYFRVDIDFDTRVGPEARRSADRLPGLEIVEVADGFDAMLNGKRVGRLRDNLPRGAAQALDEDASVDIVKVDDEVRGKGVGRALYEAFNERHGGRIIPSGKTSKEAWRLWKAMFPEKVDKFVRQEAERIRSGASPQLVVGNITDPEVASRVSGSVGGAAILSTQRSEADIQSARADGWIMIDNDLPSKEAAERIIRLRKHGNSVVRPLPSWVNAEVRVMPSDNPGLWSIELRTTRGLGGADDQSGAARSTDRDITNTDAFKRWFGDSKVVDADGRPLVFYHGGAPDFTGIRAGGRFDGAIFVRQGAASGYGKEQHALYVKGPILELDEMASLLSSGRGRRALEKAARRSLGDDEAELLKEALTDGSHYPAGEDVWGLIGAIDEADAQVEIQKLRGAVARELGFQSVRTPDEFDGETVMVLSPEQIKSATGNSGAFDPNDADITRSADRITDSDAFKRWFGDSVMTVDGKPGGEPMRLFHGGFDFRSAAPGRAVPKISPRGALGSGFYMTPTEAFAQDYADENKGVVTSVYARITNPLKIDNTGTNKDPAVMALEALGVAPAKASSIAERAYEVHGYLGGEIRKRALDAGYDGLVRYRDGKLLEALVWNPSQVKSADNNGDFSWSQDIYQSTDRPRFYSQLSRAIEQAPDRVANQSAAQWKLWLDANAPKLGVKKDEIEWSGIKDYLDLQGKAKVTRDQLVAYLGDSGVRIEETVLGSTGLRDTGEMYVAEANDWGDEWAVFTEDGAIIGGTYGSEGAAERAMAQMNEDGKPTKYGSYTVPGGENYREVLITLPSIRDELIAQKYDMESRGALLQSNPNYGRDRRRYDALLRRIVSTQDYKSSHWDQPNILAHLRVDDRTDADGRRVLFINELQSDWGQDGKKKGFNTPLNTDGWTARRGEGDPASGPVWEVRNERGHWVLGIPLEKAETPEQAVAYAARQGESARGGGQGGVTSAPFVTDTKAWVALALKRAIMMASDGGYDRVALITGQQAADLYDLSKQVDSVVAYKVDGGYKISARALDGDALPAQSAKNEQELADIVGKEFAERIVRDLNAEGMGDSAVQAYSGLDLKVGGEGMRAFYDEIVPQVARDVLKKIGGGKVGEVKFSAPPRRDDGPVSGSMVMERLGIPEAQQSTYWGELDQDERERLIDEYRNREPGEGEVSQPGFDITPEMREKIRSEGLPLFSRDRNQTETPEFKRWFGDSKVVDESGRPMVVYHGTVVRDSARAPGMGDIVAFDRMFTTRFRAASIDNVGSWFSSNPGAGGAEMYSGRGPGSAIYPAYLSIKNPHVTTFALMLRRARLLANGKDDGRRIGEAEVEAFRKWLMDTGKDGVKIESSGSDTSTEFDNQEAWIALEPGQIKSAIGNNGGFDPTDPDIRRSRDREGSRDYIVVHGGSDFDRPNAGFQGMGEGRGQRGAVRPLGRGLYGYIVRNAEEAGAAVEQVRSYMEHAPTKERAIHAFKVSMSPGEVGFGSVWDEGLMTPEARERRAAAMAADALPPGPERRAAFDAIEARGPQKSPAQLKSEVDALPFNTQLLPIGLVEIAVRDLDRLERVGKWGADTPDSEIVDAVSSAVNNLSLSTGRADWSAPGASKWDDMVYKLQDKQIDTKRVVEAVREASGAISDDLDVYLREELFHGRTAKRSQDFVDRELQPLVDGMAKDGLKIEELDEFLHARHAREANAVIASRNPALQDGGSGMLNQDAEAYFAQLTEGKREALERAAAKVDAMIARTRQLMVDYELESPKVVDGWASMFKHYVPLMREEDSPAGTGQGFSIRGREVKSRTGSTRKVVDILANIAMQRERTIVRGEKNRVSQALFGLAAIAPNDDFWTVDTNVPTEQVFNPKTGLVERRTDNLYKQRPNVVVTKVLDGDGNLSERAVIFNDRNERALRAAAALKNLDAAQLEGLLGASAKVTRYFASINTQYNPVFGVVNLVRDIQGAMINLGSTDLAGQQRRIATDTIKAIRAVYSDARAARKGGASGSRWAQLWEEFQEVGGQTGFRELFRTSADRAKAIEKALDPDAWMSSRLGRIFTANGALKVPMSVAARAARWLFDWLSDYNLAMENGVRLATYKAGLDAGLSKERAASIAKNLTTNFNRRGQIGQQAGAVYAFFNASMQGTARIGQTIFEMEPGKPNTIRLSPLGKKVVYGGMLLGSLQSLMLAAAGFTEDDPPEWARERGLIIPTGGKSYITIPMPLGFHVIPGLGRTATDFALRGFTDPARYATTVIGMFADAFNPIGNAGLSMQTISPTALDPLVAITENRDWSGRPIARESRNPAVPGHELARDTSTAISRLLSEGINYMTGGTKYTAGVLSPTPDQIDYLAGQVGGGVWRELSKVEQTAKSLVTGESLPTYKVPLVGRFVGSSASQASEGAAFYANVGRLNRLETEIKGLQEDGRREEAAALRRGQPMALLIGKANAAEREIQRLRKQKSELVKAGADRTQVRAVEEKITAAMARLNRAVEAARASE